jgi:type IV pilus assembly protein PilM
MKPMFGLTGSQVQPIGVDFGHDSVKMLQLEVRGGRLVVHAAARQSLETSARINPERAFASAVKIVREMLRGGDFQGKRIVAALPRDIVHIKNLRLPIMPAAELVAVIRTEAKGVFPFDLNEARVEFLPAGEVRQGTDVRQEVLVLATKHEDVDRFVERVHGAGVVIDSLDVEPCALYRGVERFVRRREDDQEVFVMLDIGLRRSHVLIGKGRDISFFKPIEIGGGRLNEAVSKKLGISDDEARALRRRLGESGAGDPGNRRDSVRRAVFDATRSTMEELAREVSLCLRYHAVTFRGHRPGKVRLLGGEAYDPQLLAILKSVLPITIETGRPLFSADCSVMKASDKRGSAEWALALGLALKRTTERFAPLDGKPRHMPEGTVAPATAEKIAEKIESPVEIVADAIVADVTIAEANAAKVADTTNSAKVTSIEPAVERIIETGVEVTEGSADGSAGIEAGHPAAEALEAEEAVHA